MTHEQYLEQHHETANTALAAIATKMAQAEYALAETMLIKTRAILDDLWQQRVEAAAREVNP